MNRSFLIRHVPNLLSLTRAGLGVTFPLLPHSWRPGVVVLAAATDALDGLTARWLGVESDVGRLLDPVADKVFVLMLVGVLVADGTIHPLWAAGLAARDLAVLAGAAAVALRRRWASYRRMRPTWLGKAATAGQFVALLAAVAWGRAPLGLLAAATALSAAAAIDYAAAFVRRSRTGPDPP